MTEITLTLDDPELAASQLRHAANHWNDGPPKSNPVGDLLLSLADSIEEQLKPAVDEPQEFGSLIFARHPDDPEYVAAEWWQLCPSRGEHYWESQSGEVELWSELLDVRVKRVGHGVSSEAYHRESWRNGYQLGIENTRDRITRRLEGLKRDLITSVEKTAIDKAIAKVEEDAADTVYGRGDPS